MGNIVSDKMSKKIHELTETIYACGAGGAAVEIAYFICKPIIILHILFRILHRLDSFLFTNLGH